MRTTREIIVDGRTIIIEGSLAFARDHALELSTAPTRHGRAIPVYTHLRHPIDGYTISAYLSGSAMNGVWEAVSH